MYVLQLNFVYSITGFVAFMLPILIVPKYFLALGIFAAFMKSFGVSLTPLVLGGIFYEIISALDPILLTLLGIWTVWKVFLLRRPLVDVNYWKHRMSARCCSRRSSNWSPSWKKSYAKIREINAYTVFIHKQGQNMICIGFDHFSGIK